MQNKDFISYEYKTKQIKSKDQTIVMDIYEAFGWEVTTVTPTFSDNVTLSLKRDRKQKHKQELIKLERQSEELFQTIESLNKSKTSKASVFAYIFGCFASLVLGGGMSLTMVVENNIPVFVCGIILGLIGFSLCGVNYFIYKKIVEKQTRQLSPIIDDNEEKLANLLEKSNNLLQTDII